MSKGNFRVEKDFLGELEIRSDAYYGIQTERARRNFPVSGWTFPSEFIWALGLIKWAAAQINMQVGLLPPDLAKAICQAAEEVMTGKFDRQFVVDVFQTGSGTSTNMNANEVIANRAIEILGGSIGSKSPVHTNNHVNLSQSSNDVIPTAIHLAAVKGIDNGLLPALLQCRGQLEKNRDQLPGGKPFHLSERFAGYEQRISLARDEIIKAKAGLLKLTLGGTAVGTGFGAPAVFGRKTIGLIAQKTGQPFEETDNHFAAQAGQEAACFFSATLTGLAVILFEIGNDLRLLASGPRCGVGAICLPAVQPGSSIMPGKVNPVIIESMLQVCVQVIAYGHAITLGASFGNLELNTFLPVIGYDLLQSIRLMSNGIVNLTTNCLTGITIVE